MACSSPVKGVASGNGKIRTLGMTMLERPASAWNDENLRMASRTSISTQNKPLTPLMLTVLQHLAARQDHALVRLHSNYWIAESDANTNPMFREIRDMDDRLLVTSWLAEEQPPMVVVRTPTVNAMVARGLLKLVGPKRAVRAVGNRKDYSRAVLTTQATAIRGAMEDQSQAAYEEVLRRLR